MKGYTTTVDAADEMEMPDSITARKNLNSVATCRCARRVAIVALGLLTILSGAFAVEYPFTSLDIFANDFAPGSTTSDPASDTYTVTADGHDIWDSGDDFRFLYVEMSGDFSVSVRVDDPAGLWPHSWSKAGIMVRQDLSPGSKDVYVVATRDNGVAFQWRDKPDSLASWTGSSEPPHPLTYPIYLRIVRSGDAFTGWYSDDGKSWVNPTQNRHVLPMTDPVRVGICLTSHLTGVFATATFGDFHIPEFEASTVAIPPPDQTAYEGDTVFLDGTRSWNASWFRWEQVFVGDEPEVVINQQDQSLATFVAPQLDTASILTFQLTVFSSKGKDSALTRAAVRARNAPTIPPTGLRAQPGNLSLTLRWKGILDADSYTVKRAEQPPGGQKSAFQTIKPSVTETTTIDEYLEEGVNYSYVVAAKNFFAPYEGPPSSEVSITAMPNLALRSDAQPIAFVTAPTGGGLRNLNSMMNGDTEENYDTYDDYYTLDEDWFGYSWPQSLYFDHIALYEGEHFYDGGWWTSLTVQFSDDGLTWKDAPNVTITPPYDFTDSRLGRRRYSRFDLTFKPIRGSKIRIYGTPGGIAGFTSIAELEVYGSQQRQPLVVYGVDRTVGERQMVVLDATYSFSTRGPIAYYQWQQTGGPSVTIDNPDSPLASFAAPGVEEDTLLTFSITAGDGIDQKTDDVSVHVGNLVTQADAGADTVTVEKALVQLDGTASATTSGQLTYQWTQLDGSPVLLSDAASARTGFTAPSVWDFSEKLVFQLLVDDGLGRPESMSTDNVIVQVKNTLTTMPHVEKSGLLVIEAENYSSLSRKNDLGCWEVVEGQITYVEVPDIPGDTDKRIWEQAAEISYDVTIRRPGEYYIKLRRFVLHGAGHDGGENNSCRIGMNGQQRINIFDDAENFNRWLWTPSQYLHFLNSGDHSIQIRCREDGYRIDRIIVHQLESPALPDDWSPEIGPTESNPISRIVGSRELGTHYTPGASQTVSLQIDVNTPYLPERLTVTEYFPAAFSVIKSGGGDSSVPGRLVWSFSGGKIASRTLSYALAIPKGTATPATFDGVLSYSDTNEPISGQTILYPIPSPPTGVTVEMLVDATISWISNAEDGVVAYHVYRSQDGIHWTDISGPRRQGPFLDTAVEPHMTYIYKVVAENPAGAQTPLSDIESTPPQAVPSMHVREAEDYDYDGGLSPGGPNAPPAIRASRRDDLAPERDYFYQNTSQSNAYRPQDPVDIRPGEGASGWFMGFSTPGDWWRYTFEVPIAGYVKLAFRGATDGQDPATIEFFWDEGFVGKIIYNTPGGWRDWTYYSLEPFFSAAGRHVLRVRLSAGNADYDLIALGYDWPLGGRKVIYGEDFTQYASTSEVETLGGWTIISGSSSQGAWQLWDTLGEPLTGSSEEPGPDLPGLTRNYMVANGDFAPDIPLDEQLLSPEINCAGYDRVTVQFASHINIYQKDPDGDLQTTDFDLSVYDPQSDSWSDWNTLFTHNHLDGDLSSPMPLSFDLSSLVDGKTIKFRWHFYHTRYDFWWAIDDVVLSGRPVAKPGISAMQIDSGESLTLSWEPFGTGYYVIQHTDDLSNPSWTDAEGAAWPIIATSWTATLPPDHPMRFFRVVSP